MFSDQQNTPRERGWQYSYVQELRVFSVKRPEPFGNREWNRGRKGRGSSHTAV